MNNKALLSDAPRLSGRAGADKGNPSPTATHLSRYTPNPLFFSQRVSAPSYITKVLGEAFVGEMVSWPREHERTASQAAVLPAGVTNGSPAVSAPTNSYGGELGAV